MSRRSAVWATLLAAVILWPAQPAQAIPASPTPVVLTQPDGTTITLQPRGDEHFHWFEDAAGYTVVRSGKSYVYGQLDGAGKLVPTSLLVGQANPAASGLSPKQLPARAQRPASALRAPAPQPAGYVPRKISATGTLKNLVVLCRFSDHGNNMIRSTNDFNVLFNSTGTNAIVPTGSVRECYKQNSYGALTLDSTIVTWVTLPHTEGYYTAGVDGFGTYPRNAQGMVEDALDLVDGLVDFGDFDTDNDGYIDSISIVHSGYDAATTAGGGDWIWSHRWVLYQLPAGQWISSDLNNSGVPVKVYDYHTEPALWGTSGNQISRIGVIAHETGHFLGLPDLYDTETETANSEGIGSWCMMANSWGFDTTQLHPPHFSAWSKIQLGWVTPTVINPGSYSAPYVESNAVIYKITQGYPAGEYLLIENRQPVGIESTMPQGGLAIWHIDENKPDNDDEGYPGQSGWPANNKHYAVALLQADGRYDLEHGSNRGDASDVYRGGGGVSTLSATTTPNTHAYQGGSIVNNGNAINNISASGLVMTFNYVSPVEPPRVFTLFTGTNSVNAGTNFSFTTPAGMTNFSLVVPGSATAYSHLMLKMGTGASETNFDFVSRLNSQTNSIHLELPEAVATNWSLRVQTPASSLSHAFTVTMDTNHLDLRTVRPAMKIVPPLAVTGTVAPATWNYFRFEIPAEGTPLKISLTGSSNVAPDLYLQRNALPTTANNLKKSTGTTNDLIYLTDQEATVGAYFLGVYSPSGTSGNVGYTLQVNDMELIPLSFDPGDTAAGTDVYTNTVTADTNFVFKIRTGSPALGAWRTALQVLAGEADLYLSLGKIPTPTTFDFKSDRVGSDGVVLNQSQFSAGQDWYILVTVKAGSSFSLVSGSPFVMDFGNVTAATNTAITNLTVGAEGWTFFKTVVPANTLAWRLWLTNSAAVTNATIYVKTNSLPTAGASDLSQAGHLLVVPPYLVVGRLYFVGVQGPPGTVLALDSRQHEVTDIPYANLTNAFSTNLTVQGYGYKTFRVQVPVNEIAWQVNVIPGAGNPNLALRRNLVPNENYNDAFSEVAGLAADSVSLVPPNLSDGTFFITVYPAGTGTNENYTCTLRSGPPTITDINYEDLRINDETNRVGWRYYRVLNTASQLGTLGWELFLSNAAPGTKIALRKNAAPSIWTSRNPGNATANVYDFLSTADFLQRPAHQADIWYIGIYNPTNVLGSFTLLTRQLLVTTLNGDGGTSARTNVPAGFWHYFRVDVPAGILGWDLRLTNVTGSPRLIVRRDNIPVGTANSFTGTGTATNWASGAQWVPTQDWTRRQFAPDGTTDENGRILAAGMGRPLEPGTYYIGVINTTGTNVMNYTLWSRFVQAVPDLAYSGGVGTNSLPAREADYYRVTIGSGVPSWKLRLTVNSGEAMLVVSTNKIPNVDSEKRVQKAGREHYVLAPSGGQLFLTPGDYYVAVVSEGQTPAANNRVGSGSCNYTLESLGAAPDISLGTLDTEEITYSGDLEGGETVFFRLGVVPDVLGYEIFIDDTSTNATLVVHDGITLPDPGQGGDNYGSEGGTSQGDEAVSNYLINVSGNSPTNTFALKARLRSGSYPDTTYFIRIRRYIPEPVTFDGGTFSITNSEPGFMKFARVDVPADAAGWDVRLENVQGLALPRIVVARDILPVKFATAGVSETVSAWPSGASWVADKDWSGRGSSPTGASEANRVLAWGMGRPLSPGTYYVGISTTALGTNSYTLRSRGIGNNQTIKVPDLAFTGGVSSSNLLFPREAAYFRVSIPENTPGWQLKLTATNNSEIALVALRDKIPNVKITTTTSATNAASPGRRLQKAGDEQFLLLPSPGQTNLLAGDYYLAVIGEGQSPADNNRIGTGTNNFTLTSLGALTITNLGTLTNTDLTTSAILSGGACAAYQFTVGPNVTNMEVRLQNRTGNPALVVRPGPLFPDPGNSGNGVGTEAYGHEGGETSGNLVHASFLAVANPTNGVYHVFVQARATNSAYVNASYTLRVNVVGSSGPPIDLAYDGGNVTITNQPPNSWKYFQVEIPTNNVGGWDLRLTGVSTNTAKLVVRRDVLPSSLSTTPWSNPGNLATWPSSNQWAAGSDWTKRQNSAAGSDENNRILAMGLNRPLEPGTYYVGVTNTSGTLNVSYTLYSRGIGSNLTLPVIDLPFTGGVITNLSLNPREAAYYRTVIPSNTPSWKLRVTGLSGDFMLSGLRNFLPHVNLDNGFTAGLANGKAMQKSGNEHFLLLPVTNTTSITPGTNYFAVIGEGVNPVTGRVGTGPSSYVIASEGTADVHQLGTLSSEGLEEPDTLGGGEVRFYQFTILPGTFAVELKLDNRIGNPVMVGRSGTVLPDPGALLTSENYGTEGGFAPSEGHPNLLTLANPTPGTYTLAIKARATGGVYSDASYRLRLRVMPVQTLNFSAGANTNGFSNVVSGLLEDNQRIFYRVEVPATFNGTRPLGWKLELTQSSGLASVRVRKDALPSDSPVTGIPFTSPAAYIVNPYLTNGTWYVEVRGQNATAFILTSAPLEVERPAWNLPSPGDTNPAPGLTLPVFGDTAYGTNGVPLPGDQSLFLEQGYQHYYAVNVPAENFGLFRFQLDAVSGNPDLWIRFDEAPTTNHNAAGNSGTLFDRQMTATGTEYANWVPLNGKTEAQLKPGLWYLTVRANANANARYRLRLSAGTITDLAITNSSLTNQVLAGGDWRYYRVRMPEEVPLTWSAGFSVQSGDVDMYLRDTIPPGQGNNNVDYRDWTDDAKNNGPYPSSYATAVTNTFTTPFTRVGNDYYLGFRAINDAVFSVTVFTNGAPLTALPTLAFYGGSVTNNSFPGNAQVTYRIDVPADAVRWKHFATNVSTLQFYLEQGTLPFKSSNDDWRSSSAVNTTFSQLLNGSWPWLTNQPYFLTISNTAATPTAFIFTMNGRNAATEDADADNLYDVWETQYFTNLTQNATGDFDADGVNNLNEFLEGTHPANNTSFMPRLTLSATSNGFLTKNPTNTNFVMNATVTLTAFPTNGYALAGWTGSASGTNNPLLLTMNGHKTVGASFKIIGDDFLIRVPLAGSGISTNGRNVNGTKETGESNHAGNGGGKSVWWTWTAPYSGSTVIDTAGSDFNTLLAVYTGTAVNAVTLVTNNASGAAKAKVTFNAVAGTTYQIAVDGISGANGNIALSINTVGWSVLSLPALTGPGPFQFQLRGEAGRAYTVEASTNLTTWSVLPSVTNSVTGVITVTDPAATNSPRRFYRTRYP